MRRPAYLHCLAILTAALLISPAALAVTVVFTGANGPGGQGVLGSAFVPRGSIAHMNAFYTSVGTTGPYTEVATPDAFDFTTGALLAPGSNPPPTRNFGATSTGHGLGTFGITGDLHIGLGGFTLDFNNPADLFTTSATSERRIYRNGSAIIVEETAPNTFVTLASYANAIFTVDIDYTTGAITNTFQADLLPGSNPIFPELWLGSSSDPIDVAGSTSNGPYGSFSVLTSMEVEAPVPAPPALAIGLFAGIGLLARRRKAP